MSFLEGLGTQGAHERYAPLGYSRNPFPQRGQVDYTVYVDRPELADLRKDLMAFLGSREEGSVWALQGGTGVGKSNFLRNVERELEEVVAAGIISKTGFRLVAGMSLTPQSLIREVLDAIGTARIEAMLKSAPALPHRLIGTDFGRFWGSASKVSADKASAAGFLVRWLGGVQTYVGERANYQIHARERLPPAVAFPFVHGLVELLRAASQLDRLVLLFDEFEDVEGLTQARQTEYIQVLKTLLNTFNWKGLYVILAGQPAAFVTIGTKHPSLASRWRVVSLLPVQTAKDAVALAVAYKDAAKAASGKGELPTDDDVKAEFIALSNVGRIVTQRMLLAALHDWIEAKS